MWNPRWFLKRPLIFWKTVHWIGFGFVNGYAIEYEIGYAIVYKLGYGYVFVNYLAMSMLLDMELAMT